MNRLQLLHEIIALYRKHGWRLERALLRSETRAELDSESDMLFDSVTVRDELIDALWFARASPEGREAWELRLVAESPYALFETFEADEAEEDREDVRREMEARLREHVMASSHRSTNGSERG